MKTYKQINEEMYSEALGIKNALKYLRRIGGGLAGAIIPSGRDIGSGIANTAKGMLVPKDEQNPVASASKLKGPREGK